MKAQPGFRKSITVMTAALATPFATGAYAATVDEPPPPVATPASAPSPGTTTSTTTSVATTTESAPIDSWESAPTARHRSDHDLVVGRLGVGYFGQFDLPLGFGGARRAGGTEAVQLVGVRYWWTRVRLDVSFGINMQSGSQQVPDAPGDQTSTLVVGARVALPIALFVGDHYTFFVGPEIAWGHGGETIPGGSRVVNKDTVKLPDTTHSGNRYALGARAGVEIQFGFLGIPHLALDATVGLQLDLTNGTTNGPPSNPAPSVPPDPFTSVETHFSHMALQSTTGHQPWNIFISNVAAVYYF